MLQNINWARSLLFADAIRSTEYSRLHYVVGAHVVFTGRQTTFHLQARHNIYE